MKLHLLVFLLGFALLSPAVSHADSGSLAGTRHRVIVSTDIRYLAPVRHGDRVRIESSLVKVERHGVKLEIAMLDAASGHLKSLLWSQLRFVDLERNIIVNHSVHIQAFFDGVRLHTEAVSLDQRIREIKAMSTLA